MATYHIIDEPKTQLSHRLIINPIGILLAAMMLSMFFPNIPLYGKFWLPFAWFILNGFWLGSPTFWREVFYSLIGLLCVVIAFFAFGYGIKTQLIDSPNTAAPYFRVFVNGIFFAALYSIAFTQSAPYSIYEYVKQQVQHG